MSWPPKSPCSPKENHWNSPPKFFQASRRTSCLPLERCGIPSPKGQVKQNLEETQQQLLVPARTGRLTAHAASPQSTFMAASTRYEDKRDTLIIFGNFQKFGALTLGGPPKNTGSTMMKNVLFSAAAAAKVARRKRSSLSRMIASCWAP